MMALSSVVAVEKWEMSQSGSNWKVEPLEFPVQLDVECVTGKG